MTRRTSLMVSVMMAMTLSLALGVIQAQAKTKEEDKLAEIAEELDKTDVAPKEHEARVQAFADRYEVPAGVVQGMREGGKGWGEINNSLAIAQRYSEKTQDSDSPVSREESLEMVLQMRSDGMGYGQIAKTMGFKLGPVVSASRKNANVVAKKEERVRRAKPPKKTEVKPPKPPKPDRPPIGQKKQKPPKSR